MANSPDQASLIPQRVQQRRANSGYEEWTTPSYILDAARTLWGGAIDLDPASSELSQTVVRADRFFTKADDGLAKDWDARTVWLNPPYSAKGMAAFVAKARVEWEAKRFGELLVITNSATETRWGQSLAEMSNGLCLLRGRVAFLRETDEGGELYTPKSGTLQGQVVWYCTTYDDPPLDLFGLAFAELGACFWR